MKKLEPPDTHYLSAASGWLGLGDWREAQLELSRIAPEFHLHPDVLEVRYEMCSKARLWDDALAAARSFIETAPGRAFGWVHAAYALHELSRTREAYDLLLPKLDCFPKDWVFQYNLACYACQLGRNLEAIERLGKALKLGNPKELKQMAMEDPDLAPLRAAIPGIQGA